MEALKTEFAGKGLRFSRGTYAFPEEGPGTLGDTIYLWQCCLPCSVTPLNGGLSPPFLSSGQLARKSEALQLTHLTPATRSQRGRQMPWSLRTYSVSPAAHSPLC